MNSAPKGIFAAVATPVNAKFEVITSLYHEHCRWLLTNGCDGLAPIGTTGEANSLGVRDRLRLIEGLAHSGLPMNKIIIGTGSTSIADSVELSRTALEAGANGILMLPPFYYKNPTEDGPFQLL